MAHTIVSVTYGVGDHDRGGISELGRLRLLAVDVKLLVALLGAYLQALRAMTCGMEDFMMSIGCRGEQQEFESSILETMARALISRTKEEMGAAENDLRKVHVTTI
jgi:hypothetical protein